MDYESILDENMRLRCVITGPTVWIGGIQIKLHVKEMEKDRILKKRDYQDIYYWPKLWFPQLTNFIVYKKFSTE